MLERIGLALAIGLAACGIARAEFPERPIKLIVPVAAGGLTDSLARIVGDSIGKELGQTVLVDNRSGGSGAVAMLATAHAEPDGHTLVFVYQGVAAVNPVLYKKPAYDTLKQFAPVSLVGTFSVVLAVDPALKVSTVKDFIALAKTKPGALNYGTAGVATTSHLAMELFKGQAGIDLTHVPYRGELLAIQDVVAGRIAAIFATPAVANPLAAAGKVKIIGVSTRDTDPLAPDLVPIIKTVPGFHVEGWYGVLAPAATPAPVVAKLNAAIKKALAAPETLDKLKKIGVTPQTSSPEQFRAFIAEEMQKWQKVIRDAKISVD